MVPQDENKNLRLLVVGSAAALAFGGAAFWFWIQFVQNVPPPVAVFYAALGLWVNVAIAASFPSHPVYDMVKKRVDLSSYQFWVALSIAALAWYLGGYLRDWLYLTWHNWNKGEPQAGQIVLSLHIIMLVIFLLPGGAMFPMKELDAIRASQTLTRANLLEIRLNAAKAVGNDINHKYLTARFNRALLTDKLKRGNITEREMEYLERLTNAAAQPARPQLSGPSMDEEVKAILLGDGTVDSKHRLTG